MFSSPLRLSEVIFGTLVLSILKALLSILIMLFLAYGLFGFNLTNYGWGAIAFYIFNMFIFGWAFGFFTASLIFRFGTKVQALAWSLILLIYPISGVFYPLDTLPSFLARVARFLPISYIFEGLRSIIVSDPVAGFSVWFLILTLNLAYLALGVWLFVSGFHKAKERGWFINPI